MSYIWGIQKNHSSVHLCTCKSLIRFTVSLACQNDAKQGIWMCSSIHTPIKLSGHDKHILCLCPVPTRASGTILMGLGGCLSYVSCRTPGVEALAGVHEKGGEAVAWAWQKDSLTWRGWREQAGRTLLAIWSSICGANHRMGAATHFRRERKGRRG